MVYIDTSDAKHRDVQIPMKLMDNRAVILSNRVPFYIVLIKVYFNREITNLSFSLVPQKQCILTLYTEKRAERK